jgi:hypothetical protein
MELRVVPVYSSLCVINTSTGRKKADTKYLFKLMLIDTNGDGRDRTEVNVNINLWRECLGRERG